MEVNQLFPKQLRHSKPKQLPARRRQPLQFDSCHSGLLQRGDVMFRANRRSDEIIELRRVTEAENYRRILLLGVLFEKVRKLRTRKKRIRAVNLLLRINKRSRKDLSRLHGAHIRA